MQKNKGAIRIWSAIERSSRKFAQTSQKKNQREIVMEVMLIEKSDDGM